MPFTEGGAIAEDNIILKSVNSSHLTKGRDIVFAYTHDEELHALGMINTAAGEGYLDLFDHREQVKITGEQFTVVGDVLTHERDEVLRSNIAHVFGRVAARASRMPGPGQEALF